MDTTAVPSAGQPTQIIEPVVQQTNPKRSLTKGVVIGLAIILLIVFVMTIIIFFTFFNSPATHQITVLNNCSQSINVLFGAAGSNLLAFFKTKSLSPGQTTTYFATPGVSVVMQAYRPGDTLATGGASPFTTVELVLAGNNFNGTAQVTDGSEIITDIVINRNVSDQYGVSMQGGFNLPITITSTGFNNRDPQNKFSCVGPAWNRPINADQCPPQLQAPGTGSQYEVCLAPCTAIGGPQFCCSEPGICSSPDSCQSQWPDPDFFTVFKDACPNCLVTNCETLNYSCGNSGGLTQYLITVCP